MYGRPFFHGGGETSNRSKLPEKVVDTPTLETLKSQDGWGFENPDPVKHFHIYIRKW